MTTSITIESSNKRSLVCCDDDTRGDDRTSCSSSSQDDAAVHRSNKKARLCIGNLGLALDLYTRSTLASTAAITDANNSKSSSSCTQLIIKDTSDESVVGSCNNNEIQISISSLMKQGESYFKQDKLDDAEECFMEALNLVEESSSNCNNVLLRPSSSQPTSSNKKVDTTVKNGYDEGYKYGKEMINIIDDVINLSSSTKNEDLLPNDNIQHQVNKDSENTTKKKKQRHVVNMVFDEGMYVYNQILSSSNDCDNVSSTTNNIVSCCCCYNLGQISVQRDDYHIAQQWFHKAINEITATTATNTNTDEEVLLLVKIYTNLGHCYYRMTTTITTSGGGRKGVTTADTLEDSSNARMMMSVAKQHYHQALTLCLQYGLGPYELATALNCVAVIEFHAHEKKQSRQGTSTTDEADKSSSIKEILSMFYKSLSLYRTSWLLNNQNNTDNNNTNTMVVVEATVLNNIGRVYYTLQEYDEAIVTYQQALELRRIMMSDNNDHHDLDINQELLGRHAAPSSIIDVAATVFNLATTYSKVCQYDKALTHYKEFITILNSYHEEEQEEEAQEDDIDHEEQNNEQGGHYLAFSELAHAYQGIAEIYYAKSQVKLALIWYKQALKVQRNNNATTGASSSSSHSSCYTTTIATTLVQIGSLYFELKDNYAALKYYKEAFVIEQRLLGNYHPNTLVTLTNIGHIYKTLGEYCQAMDTYCIVVSLMKSKKEYTQIQKSNTSQNLQLAETISHVGLMQYQIGNYNDAFDSYQEALRIRRECYDTDDHVHIASTLNSIGLTLFKQGSYNMAIDCFIESVRIRKILLGPNHRDLAILYYNIATSFYEKGDGDGPDIAIKYYKETVRVERIALGKYHPDVGVTLRHIGQVYQSLGMLDEALEYFHEALDIERIQQQEQEQEQTKNENEKATNNATNNQTTTTTKNNINNNNNNGSTSTLVGQILNMIGNVYLQQGNVRYMMDSFVEASRIYRSSHISESNLVIAGYNFYGLSKTLQPPCAAVA